MPRSNFEFRRIFVELFLFKILKCQKVDSPAVTDRGAFSTLLKFSFDQCSTCNVPLKTWGIVQNFNKMTSRCQQWLTAANNAGIVHIKKYKESRIFVSNGIPEVPHIIHTFVTQLHKQCGESQLCNNTGSINSLLQTIARSQLKIAGILEFEDKFEKPLDTE